MDQVLQLLPPACQENEQELLERTADHLITTWIASWYPRTPGPVLKSAVKGSLAKMVKGLDQLDVGLLIGDWSRVVAGQLAKSRVASLENSQPVLEHPIFRGRSLACHIAHQLQPILQLLLPPCQEETQQPMHAVRSKSSPARLFLGQLLAANLALSLSTAAGSSNPSSGDGKAKSKADISPSIRSEDRGFPSRPEKEKCPILDVGSHQNVAEKSPEEFSIDVRPGGKSGQAEAQKNGNEAKKIFHQPHCDMLAGQQLTSDPTERMSLPVFER